MSDPNAERGWQNVLREIRRKLNQVRRLPDEPPLHPVEVAEAAAWQLAHDAVLDRIAAMDTPVVQDPEIQKALTAIWPQYRGGVEYLARKSKADE